MDGNDAQPVEQVLPEGSLTYGLGKVDAGRSNEAHINGLGSRAAEASYFAPLDHADKLALKAKAEMGDLVQEYRPTFGQFKPAVPGFRRSRTSSFHLTQKFRFEERFGQGAAI
jgi:hypothetical protein